MAKRKEQPPKFFKLVSTFEADPASKYLRLGQWFMNNYMPKQEDDKLYNAKGGAEALGIIREYYEKYQWDIS